MVTKIKVSLVNVHVNESDAFWGAADWYLYALADDKYIGRSDLRFEARTNRPLVLGPGWELVVNTAGKAPGESVAICLWVIHKGIFSEVNLGEVRARVNHPFNTRDLEIPPLDSTAVGGHSYFNAQFQVTLEEEFATTHAGPGRVPVRRNAAGNVKSFSTVKGIPVRPRVEVCPVIPVPALPTHLPGRPSQPRGLMGGRATPAAQITNAPMAPALNSIPNPAVIPILDPRDANLANKQARLTVTYYEPGDLDTSKFHWRVVSGPAVIIGSADGPTINVRGTRTVVADTMAVFEVRWENDSGPLLATYRAWVGKLGTVRYRVTFLDGRDGHWPVSTVMTSAVANNIMQVVKAIYYQAGLMLLPDDNVKGYDGATLFPAGNTNAIFRTTVSNNLHTRNVDVDVISRSTRYNFRPGIINFVVVQSTLQRNANAVERNGIAGTAGKTIVKDGQLKYIYDEKGSIKNLDGSPSASWIKPSGVLLDKAGMKLTLKTIGPTDRVNQAKGIDQAYVISRNSAKEPFTAAMMGQLYACVVPVVWGRENLTGVPPNPPAWSRGLYVWKCGVNLAHELGHILGLAHRGSGGWGVAPPAGRKTFPSADGMDCPDATGFIKGHPWLQNIMCYGYYSLIPPPCHNIDLIQATVVRTHPAIAY
jgi:hypothetical protein